MKKQGGVYHVFKLVLENAAGDQIDMTATANQYMTSKIEGLSSPPVTISTSSYAGMDGSYLNNAFIEKRNVVIHFEMRGVGDNDNSRTVNQTNNSPKSLSRLEIYRQTRNALIV